MGGAALRETYDASGLYPIDGSTEPIWTVDWYAHDVEALSDGIHLVRPGSWASSPHDEAVSFFARGTKIRSYTVGELVASPQSLPHSVGHFTWRADTELDDEARQYRVTTLHGQRYTFDVTTGEIVSSFTPFPWLVGVGIAAGVAAGAMGFRWWRLSLPAPLEEAAPEHRQIIYIPDFFDALKAKMAEAGQ